MLPQSIRGYPNQEIRPRRGMAIALSLGIAILAGCGILRASVSHFSIPEGRAEVTLKKAALQSEVDIVFARELVRGVRTNAVKGDYEPAEVFELMLRGTPIEAVQVSEGSAYVIMSRDHSRSKTSDESNSNLNQPDNTKKESTEMYKDEKFIAAIRAGLLATAIAGSSGAYGQDDASGDEVFELSPFQVSTSEDEGYMASSTLAGTRLNSNLSDVAAAISPFTKEFINDIGADSIEELLAYSNNSTRLDETELANDNQVIEFEFQFNVRGLPATRSRNYFAWDVVSMDNFNIERVDESRGPNSILFGVGAAGGVMNTSTKQARFRNINQIQFMVGSDSQFRTAIDLNRVLIEDKLAIRFNAVMDDRETWRLWEFKDQERYHFATTFKAAEHTTLRAEIETGEVYDNLARSYLGDDHTTAWLEAGSPHRGESTADTGARNNSWITVSNDGTTYFTGGNNSYQTNVAGSRVVLRGESTDLLPWEVNPGGPDNERTTDYTVYTVSWEQSLGNDFHFELAFNHFETDFLQYDSGGGAYNLRGDVSDPTRDISPINDHSGELFYETWWGIRTRDREADTIRATASYNLDLTERKIGYHRFAAMYESMDSNSARESAFEHWADENGVLITPTAVGASGTSSRARVNRRQYITPGDFETYIVPSWDEKLTLVQNGVTYTNIWSPRNFNVQDDDVTLDSKLVSMQNFWFDSKLITTVGYREDDIGITKRGVTQDPTNQRFIVDYDTPPEQFDFSGGTTTVGVVAKPVEWLSFLFNDSDNKGLPDVNRLVLPDSSFADPSTGEGKDYGVMFNLLDGKLFARIAKFESSMIGLTAFGNRGNVETPNIRNLDVLLNAGLINDAEYASHYAITNCYTFGRDSEGTEFQLTANPTKRWSVRMNYSETDRVQFNIMPEVLAWYPGEDAFWRSFGDDVYFNNGPDGPGTGIYEPATGDDSIALESARIQRHINNVTAFEGLGDQGSRGKNANLFTNYRFSEGPLKGFNIGGGVRYLGAMTVAVDVAEGQLLWGNSKTLYDLLMGYKMKSALFGSDVDVKFQLNVRNVFDEDEPTIAGLQLDGRLDKIALQTPREFQFRTTFDF